VTGVQTIGTNNPISLLNPTGAGASAAFGSNSMLKIARNLYSTTTGFGVKGVSAQGNYPFNYANGIEITSFIPSSPTVSKGSNRSVAISVAASSTIRNSDGSLPAASGTGFFVSDTGENVAVGQFIDTTAAIGVSGAGSDFAIKAKGNIGATGDLNIVGDVNVTGDSSFIGNVGITGDVSINNSSTLTLNGSTNIKRVFSGYAFFYFNSTISQDPQIAYDISIGGGPSLPPGFNINTSSANYLSDTTRAVIVLSHPTIDPFKTTVLVTPRFSNADAPGVFFNDSLKSFFSSRPFTTETLIYMYPVGATWAAPGNNVKIGFNFTFIEHD
jgi:hypothetical protein